MPLLLSLLIVGLMLTPVHASPRQEGRLPAPVAQALRSAGIPQTAVAVLVQEAGGSRARVSVNADQPMNPASVMKLVTTYAALELLGPAHTWKTEVLAAGELKNGVLEGDLYLKGQGDPRLTIEQFRQLLRQVRARGLREVRGDLVLDRSLFAPVNHDPGRFDQDRLRPYNTGPDALLINFNSLRLTFVPEGDNVRALVDPLPAQLELVNLLKTGDGECADLRQHVRTDFADRETRPKLILTGRYPLACGERTLNVSVLDHSQYVFGVFEQAWREFGGRLTGSLKEASTPPGARVLASVESPPLAEIVRDINKWSNNVMARQVLLALAGSQGAGPLTVEGGSAAVRGWLAAKGLKAPELVLENGSGLSRVERISAASLGALLQEAWRSWVMPDFLASLPVAALDGTMRKRLKERPVAGRARMKTGTIEGVKAIAGYVLDRRGAWQLVVLLVNHPNAAASEAAQDALIDWVHAAGGP